MTGAAPVFGRRARSYDVLRPCDEAWLGRFVALVDLGDLRGRRILDVGCGTGRLTAALAEDAHAKVWGVDASAEMVAVAARTVPAGVGIRVGVAESLPFRGGWFDRVTMSLVVHLIDRPRAFAEARRVVQPEGRVAIATFHPDHFSTSWLNRFFPSMQTIDAARFPAPDLLQLDLARAGFDRFESKRLVAEETIDRDTALARIRGRHISTFDLLSADEIDEGTSRAEREVPEHVTVRLDQVIAVGRAA